MGKPQKIIIPIIVGILAILTAMFVMTHEYSERFRLFTEVIKDIGVVIVGISVVELVWLLVGGDPKEIAITRILNSGAQLSAGLSNLQSLTNETVRRLDMSVDAVSEISTIVRSSQRTGLVDVGETQDQLGYPPTRLINDIRGARSKIDLLGVVLDIVYSNDSVLDALVTRAKEGIPVRILVSGENNPYSTAIFDDRFREDVAVGAHRLVTLVKTRAPEINLRKMDAKVIAFNLVRVDDYMVISPYLNSTQSTEAPRFAIRGESSPLFQIYAKEFSRLFEQSTTA